MTKDEETLRELLPSLDDIIRHHRAGTLFGIHVDHDGLLTQGDPHLPLTWMDAKVGDWVEAHVKAGDLSFDEYPKESLAEWHERQGLAR